MRNSTWKQVLQENIDFRDSYFTESHCIPIKLTIKEKISTKSFFLIHFAIVTSRWPEYSTRCGFQNSY